MNWADILVVEIARLAGARDPEAVAEEATAGMRGYAPADEGSRQVIARVHELVKEGR